MNNTSLIVRREYFERVNKKSFIITTILVPLLIVALMLLPALIMSFSKTETKTIAVVDDSGIILPALQNSDEVRYISAWTDQRQMLQSDSIYGVLIIDRNILSNPRGARLLTPNEASVPVETNIVVQMNKIIETEKLKSYNIENLDEILADVRTGITLQSIRTDENGDEEQAQSATINSLIGTALNFVLYMFLLIYGALVMTSIIEEKNNRVLELVVSSVKPTQLMLGKIIGVGLVAFTQILIWAAVILCVTGFVLPAVIPTGTLAEATAITSGTATDSSMGLDMALALSSITDLGYIIHIGLLLIGFLIGGYLLYASVFAAIGASVDNQQDASQLQIIGVLPILVGLISSMVVVGEPSGTFAVVMSMIPFTAPMVMMARVPFGIPAWQIVLSLVILAVSVMFMIWLAAKIYRVGIFMYGKKPSVRDLIRWTFYK